MYFLRLTTSILALASQLQAASSSDDENDDNRVISSVLYTAHLTPDLANLANHLQALLSTPENFDKKGDFHNPALHQPLSIPQEYAFKGFANDYNNLAQTLQNIINSQPDDESEWETSPE